MTRRARSQQQMQAGSLLPPRPFTPAELRSELLSTERHLRLLHRQRRLLKHQLLAQPPLCQP